MPRRTRHGEGSPPMDGLEDGGERMLRAAKASQDVGHQDVDDVESEVSVPSTEAAGEEGEGEGEGEGEEASTAEEEEQQPPAPIVPVPVVVAAIAVPAFKARNPKVRRRRRVIRDSLQGISKASLRRLARRGGCALSRNKRKNHVPHHSAS